MSRGQGICGRRQCEMNLQDFNLFARIRTDSQLELEVTGSPVGQTREPVAVLYDSDLFAHRVDELEGRRIAIQDLIALDDGKIST